MSTGLVPESDFLVTLTNELRHEKTNKVACAPRDDSDQPWQSPSQIRVFAVRLKGCEGSKLALCWQWRLWSDWADAQADLSRRWAHITLCWFSRVTAQIISELSSWTFLSAVIDIADISTNWLLRNWRQFNYINNFNNSAPRRLIS